jgi:two-component system, OmpR family, response regulator BaeR
MSADFGLPLSSSTVASRRILVVEDDAKIADMLSNYLQVAGYGAEVCGNGLQAVASIQSQAPALVLLDLMLPGLDGLAVCQAVRRFSAVPIIMLTARVDEIDRLLGLDTGADDYICKPFSPREVVARIKALLRRAEGALADALTGNTIGVNVQSPAAFQINEAGQHINWCGKPLPLTPVEFRLLRALLLRPGQVLARARLLDSLHEDMRDTGDRAIDSHIKNLRRKLEQAGASDAGIASVYGVGYRLDLMGR